MGKITCPDCGKLVLYLASHGCTGAKKAKPEPPPEQRHLTSKEQQIMHGALRKSVKIISEPVPRSDVKRSLVKPSTITAKRKEPSSTERTRRWREANRERDREYRRDYMRKWRSE